VRTLGGTEAFGAFYSGIGERCEEAPVPADATVVGSYRMSPH
jgi:hypothetical protein